MRITLSVLVLMMSLNVFAAEDCERINDSRRSVVEKKTAVRAQASTTRTSLRK